MNFTPVYSSLVPFSKEYAYIYSYKRSQIFTNPYTDLKYCIDKSENFVARGNRDACYYYLCRVDDYSVSSVYENTDEALVIEELERLLVTI